MAYPTLEEKMLDVLNDANYEIHSVRMEGVIQKMQLLTTLLMVWKWTAYPVPDHPNRRQTFGVPALEEVKKTLIKHCLINKEGEILDSLEVIWMEEREEKYG
jgi:hypothetical protein